MLANLRISAAILLALAAPAGDLRAQAPQDPVSVAGDPAAAPGDPAAAPGDPAARLYVSRCTGCHTIGRGMLTGPDLTAALAWREPDLEAAILRMQEKAGPLSKDEVSGLIAFLKDAQVKERIAAEETRITQQFAAKLEPPSAAAGERLFRGQQLLQNGGMACIACHGIGSVGGGTLGLDLSGVFGRMGETGLVSALEKAPFLVMAPVYREKPITRQEALHIARWIQEVDAQAPAPGADPVMPAAASVAALGLAALVFLSRRTRRTSMRAALAVRRRS